MLRDPNQVLVVDHGRWVEQACAVCDGDPHGTSNLLILV